MSKADIMLSYVDKQSQTSEFVTENGIVRKTESIQQLFLKLSSKQQMPEQDTIKLQQQKQLDIKNEIIVKHQQETQILVEKQKKAQNDKIQQIKQISDQYIQQHQNMPITPKEVVLENEIRIDIDQNKINRIQQIRQQFVDQQNQKAQKIKDFGQKYLNTLRSETSFSDKIFQLAHLTNDPDLTAALTFSEPSGTFQIKVLSCNYSGYFVYFAEGQSNFGQNITSYFGPNYQVAVDNFGQLVIYSVGCDQSDYKSSVQFKNVDFQKQNENFQRECLNEKQNFKDFYQNSNEGKDNCCDAVIRPEQILEKIEGRFKNIQNALRQINQDNDEKRLGCELFKDCMDKYSEVVLFESIKQTITDMLNIINVKEIRDKINDQEYSLDVLRKRPHIQCLNRIMMMYKMMMEFDQKINQEQEAIKQQNIQIQQRNNQLKEQFQQQIQAYDNKIKQIKLDYQNFMNQLQNIEQLQIAPTENFDEQLQNVKSYSNKVQLKFDTDNSNFQKQNEIKENELQEQMNQKLQVLKEKLPEFQSQQIKDQIIKLHQSDFALDNMNINRAIKKLYNLNTQFEKVQELSSENVILKMQKGKIGQEAASIVNLFTKQEQSSNITEIPLCTDINVMRDNLNHVEPLIQQSNQQQLDLQLDNKKFNTSDQLLQHLLKSSSIIVMTIPVDDPLSPYCKNSQLSCYMKIYNIYLMQCRNNQVTLLIHNNMRSKIRPQVIKNTVSDVVVEPVYKQLKDVIKGTVKSASIDLPFVYDEENNQIRMESQCTARDVVINLIQNNNSEQRDILNITCYNKKQMIEAYAVGSLMFKYVAFTVENQDLHLVTEAFLYQRKYVIHDNGSYSTVAVDSKNWNDISEVDEQVQPYSNICQVQVLNKRNPIHYLLEDQDQRDSSALNIVQQLQSTRKKILQKKDEIENTSEHQKNQDTNVIRGQENVVECLKQLQTINPNNRKIQMRIWKDVRNQMREHLELLEK